MDRVSSFGLLSLLLIFMSAVFVVKVDAEGLTALRRQKREWIIPPKKLRENYNYRNVVIAKIRSDIETRTSIRYSLIGKGANMDPVGLFTVDPLNGDVRVNGMLDREETSRYELQGVASFMNGSLAEQKVDLNITVEDENDNDPIFQIVKAGSVFELSKKATFVMKITATDADSGENAEISYRILESSPMGDMFYINHQTGEIFVKQDSLDREMHASYTLKVIGSDMNGKVGSRTVIGSVVINLLDVNDNIPTLEKPNYEGSVEENTINVEVMRIKVVDLDIEFINQLSVFTIISGNEAGYFNITTDEKTSEGVITIIKALDYEELKELDIKVEVRNKQPYHSSVQLVGSMAYPIKIKVTNQLEGPKFKPAVKSFTISETSTIHTVIGTYAAIDEETGKTATNVRYFKAVDRDNWLIINENTGEIKLNKIPDRESSFVINGTYVAKIICTTNYIPSQTATGTVVIQVKDANDNCPKLPSLSQKVCAYDNAVVVSAEDADPDPNGAPFEYLVIPESTKLKWTVERINDTSAVLRSHENLWPGLYQLAVEVRDQQGKTCGPQVLDLMVRPCLLGIGGGSRNPPPSPVFGAPGVGFLLLALLLLLLVPLLLMYCTCGGKGPLTPQFPMEPTQHLINYHTEGPGEDQECPRLIVPVEVDGPVITKCEGAGLGAGWGFPCPVVPKEISIPVKVSGVGLERPGQDIGYTVIFGREGGFTVGSGEETNIKGSASECLEMTIKEVKRATWNRIALPEAYLKDYYMQKSCCAEALGIQEDELQMYDYEGGDSPAGSVGCCSDLGSNGDLSFLNDLDIKFKSLAEICQGSLTITPLTTTADTSVSSLTTETHTEAVSSIVLRPPSPSSSPFHVNEMSHMISATSSLPRVHLPEMGDVASQAYLVHPAPAQVISGTHCVLEAPSAQMLHGPSLLVTDTAEGVGLKMDALPRLQSMVLQEKHTYHPPQPTTPPPELPQTNTVPHVSCL
ncbi:hypothetical protein AGOR_G00033190 [Albula goreensis]|uniref:Cadherin domain-containing protein n=1 Tax=Albula goreensis TaxID=1534307 RepID=A0A8T3DVB3_9TELE|nr:hypothetical protein AGOR_G00033190 [Albula goreensis]